MFARHPTLRALALIALWLPGLVLSGAPHLRVCLSDVLGLGLVCAPVAQVGCCAAPGEGPSAFDAPDCGLCCISIEVAEPVQAAPLPEHRTDTLTDAALPPSAFAFTPPATPRADLPAPAAPVLVRPPGRAPTPLRI